jgi:predicted amidohydrolase YtcJ
MKLALNLHSNEADSHLHLVQARLRLLLHLSSNNTTTTANLMIEVLKKCCHRLLANQWEVVVVLAIQVTQQGGKGHVQNVANTETMIVTV